MFPPEAGSSWRRSKAFFWLMVPGISALVAMGLGRGRTLGCRGVEGIAGRLLVVGKRGSTTEAEDKGKRRERQRGDLSRAHPQGPSSSN